MVEYRLLGRTGVNVAPLAFGTDNFADPTPEEECARMLDRALDAGVNLIDTADEYGDEGHLHVVEEGAHVLLVEFWFEHLA